MPAQLQEHETLTWGCVRLLCCTIHQHGKYGMHCCEVECEMLTDPACKKDKPFGLQPTSISPQFTKPLHHCIFIPAKHSVHRVPCSALPDVHTALAPVLVSLSLKDMIPWKAYKANAVACEKTCKLIVAPSAVSACDAGSFLILFSCCCRAAIWRSVASTRRCNSCSVSHASCNITSFSKPSSKCIPEVSLLERHFIILVCIGWYYL